MAYSGLMKRPDYSSHVIGTGFGLLNWGLSVLGTLFLLWVAIVLVFHFPWIALAVFLVFAVWYYRTSGLYLRRRARHKVRR